MRRPKRERTGPRGARGFTLIELLVVVAIIALLISILLPSLQRARDHAKAITCGARLNSMGKVVAYYMEAYNGTFLAPWDRIINGTIQGGPATWEAQFPYPLLYWAMNKPIEPGMKHIDGLFWNWHTGEHDIHYNEVPHPLRGEENAPVMHCPVLAKKPRYAWGYNEFYGTVWEGWTTWSYPAVFKAHFRSGNWEGSSYIIDGYATDVKMKHPGTTVNFFDIGSKNELDVGPLPGGGWQDGGIWADYTTNWNDKNAPLIGRSDPHMEQSSYLFFDGHVELMRKDEQQPHYFMGEGGPRGAYN